MDQDLWMKSLQFHGPLLLQTVLDEVSEFEEKVESDKLNMCQFIKDKLHLLFKTCEPTSNPPKDSNIPLVPIEVFQDRTFTERRDLFFKTLDRGNILILRVINDSLPEDYKLLVLCKHDCCMKLDDLSLIMYLPKLQEELNLAGGKLESNDLIRAAVCSCDIDKRKLNVTLDNNILDDETVKLGKITENDLPNYIGNVDFGSSYVEYLHQSSYFKNPNWSDELHTLLNVKRNHFYSFWGDLDGKQYCADEYAAELKRKQSLILSKAQYAKALQNYNTGNFSDAFLYLNNALTLCSTNADALVLRGTLFSNTNNLRKAFLDIEEALKLDPDHEGARKQMSILLVAAARLHLDKEDLDRAKESVDAALHVDYNNPDAIVVIEEIRRKKANISSSSNFDKTLTALKPKNQASSSSNEKSYSRKDDVIRQNESFLQECTQKFLDSMKQKPFIGKHTKGQLNSPKKTQTKSPSKDVITLD